MTYPPPYACMDTMNRARSYRESLAWAGGLFEGEGYFTLITREHRQPYPKAGINMTDEDILIQFMETVGIGRLNGPHPTPNKPRWYWQASGFPLTQALVAMLWPWLGQRRRERAREVLIAGRGIGRAEAGRNTRTRHRRRLEEEAG